MKFIPEYKYRKLNGIYIIKNTLDDRVYIGECTNFYKRYGRHLSQLCNNKHFNIKLQNFVNKYGVDKLEFDILEICDDNKIDREIYYIQKYNSIERGFNIILDSRTMAHITNEHRKKGSDKVRGTHRNEDFRNKVKEGLKIYYKNNPNKPKAKWSEERKQARREYIKNHPEKYANRKPSSGNKITHYRGQDSVFTNLTDDIVYQIKLNMRNKVKRSITLKQFNITVNIYKDIQRGRTWKHIKLDDYEN